MDIIAIRGDSIYLIEQDNKFYLVNLDMKKAFIANPPDSPDMFLKLGYWDPVDEVTAAVRLEILNIMKKI